MRLVELARLGFREGKSDKVYEVDLVEVAPDQYVVNFRFGRRGAALRDGTKTPLPVSLDKARSVYSALVSEKTLAGYKPLATTEAASVLRAPLTDADWAAREARSAESLLAELGRGHRSATPLHLLVRKVGERGLAAAEPLLLELLRSGSPQTPTKHEVLRHFVVAALARCGSARSLAPLRTIVEDAKAPRHLRDVARLALTMLGGEEERQRALASVPAALQPSSGDASAQARAAEQLLANNPKQGHAAVFALYASADAGARRTVLAVARIARLHELELGLLRTLNWSAELRRDAELFALLSRRFENGGAAERETLDYFRRRAARTLRRLASLRSPDYVKFAAALLLEYRDDDAEDVLHTGWGTWDEFGRYHALNFVLYGNSARYVRAGHRHATWRCATGYTAGTPAPAIREESYPALWNQAPELLWQLGVSSAARVVIHFATCALRDQKAYLAAVSDATLADALARAQREMRAFAFEVARERPPNTVLARGALAAGFDEADAWVLAWLTRTPEHLVRDAELLTLTITAQSARVRSAVTELVREQRFDAAFQRELVARSVAILMQLLDEPESVQRATSAAAFLLERAGEALDALGSEVANDLLQHAVSGVAALGAELLLRRAQKGTLGASELDALLVSRHASVRSVGARIVAATPPEVIKDEPVLLVHFVLSDNAELRAGTRALLREVARLYPAVGCDVASQLLDALLQKQPEGVPAHVVSLLRHELRAVLPRREAQAVLALVNALSPHAREAGGLLLALLGPDDLELDAIVKLASHEILSIRQGSWELARAARDRFRLAPVALARLCDARWDDSRAFAFEFVRSFPPDALVPDGVIAICDSIEPKVQSFGQGLLLAYFRDEDAERYLLRLSEHPSSGIQLLVSGLLERHARGKLTLLRALLPCLATILSQVNRGGVAKQRVLAFLRSEAVSSAEAAELVAPLLERQSLTNAVSHKAPLIATLVEVHERYPDVPVPISSEPVPVQKRSERAV